MSWGRRIVSTVPARVVGSAADDRICVVLATGALAIFGSYETEWLNLVLRSLHVVAAIAWIGASFYFIALDHHLQPPNADETRRGVGGESWEIHGGGFYHVSKYRLAPERLPEPLHWFKWEAYTTWLSGFGLLVALYYASAETYLIDRSVADLSSGAAVAISVGLIAASWVIYDMVCRLLGPRDGLVAIGVVLLAVVSAWIASELFASRAAYLQVGAMLGTIMAGNVVFNIMPGQRELVAAKRAEREPDPLPGIRAKQRSVHNNYLTLPVLFTMLASHFPFTYGHSGGWLILVAFMLIGAGIRHFFNLRHQGRTIWAIPAVAALALLGLAIALRPESTSTAGAPSVSFATVQTIVQTRCAGCHAAKPTVAGFSSAPKGVLLDTSENIVTQRAAIKAQAVDSRAMPLGNVTGMTQAERDTIGDWLTQDGSTP